MVTKPCGLSDGGRGDCDAVCTLGEETRSSAGAAGTTAADPCFPLGPGDYHLTYWWDFHKQSSHIRILISDKSELFILFMILLEKEVINITLVLNVISVKIFLSDIVLTTHLYFHILKLHPKLTQCVSTYQTCTWAAVKGRIISE